MKHQYFKTSDGVRLHLLESSSGRAARGKPTLAMVPGWTMPAWLFEEQLKGLADRYRVAVLDPRGQGLSQVSGDGYTLERRTRDVAEFVARYRRVVLIGWSLGALEVLHFVHQRRAANVEALVLVDSSVGEEPKPAPGNFLEKLELDRAGEVASFVQAIFKRPRSQEQSERLFLDAMRMPMRASVDLLSYPPPRTHWRDIARAYPKPLLYVVTPQFAEQAANLQKHRPNTQIELFPDAGHALFADEPQRFNELLDRFVQDLPRRHSARVRSRP